MARTKNIILKKKNYKSKKNLKKLKLKRLIFIGTKNIFKLFFFFTTKYNQ